MADVGTDHGFLPIRLLQQGRIASAVATDIRLGPLSRAEANRAAAEISGDVIRCILCDGLEAVSQTDVDTVVIAGMGGENIADILHRAPWTRFNTRLILQPMTRPEVLRQALCESGMRIISEQLVYDSGRIYAILCAEAGQAEPLSSAELYTGRYALISKEELFPRYLREWKEKIDTALSGLSKSHRTEDAERLEHLRLVRREMTEMEERYADSL